MRQVDHCRNQSQTDESQTDVFLLQYTQWIADCWLHCMQCSLLSAMIFFFFFFFFFFSAFILWHRNHYFFASGIFNIYVYMDPDPAYIKEEHAGPIIMIIISFMTSQISNYII